jgi:hypothetical protein
MVIGTPKSKKAKFAPEYKYGGSLAERQPFGSFKKGARVTVMHNDKTAVTKGSRDN